MNENEIERIAAAINSLRPDWPTASLRTLIADKLNNRTRRDVAVALAWVACESTTKTPARVLEAGPWWQAANAEGGGAGVPFEDRCHFCSLTRERCFGTTGEDGNHVFVSNDDYEAGRRLAESDNPIPRGPFS